MICNYGKSNGDHWAQLDAGLDHIHNTPSNCDDVTRACTDLYLHCGVRDVLSSIDL